MAERGPQSPKWFAVQVRTHHEQAVAQMLVNRGCEQFLPLRKAAVNGKKRTTSAFEALFPGYLFCRVNLADRRVPVVTTPGVIRLVGIAGVPTPIPDAEIDSLQRVIESDVETKQSSALVPGQRVRITHGPLRNVEGILCSGKDNNRLIVRVTMLQRAVSIELEKNCAMSFEEPYSQFRGELAGAQIAR